MNTQLPTATKLFWVWAAATLLVGVSGLSATAWMHPLLILMAASSLGLIGAYTLSSILAISVLVCQIVLSLKVWSVAAEVGARDKHFRSAAIYRLLSVTFLLAGVISLFATCATGYSQISAQLDADNPLNAPGTWAVKGPTLIYSGSISNSFLKRLRSEIAKNTEAKVLEIESDGGYIDVAAASAKIVSRSGVTLAVRTKCQSACAYLWALSPLRALAPTALLGFHRPFSISSLGDILYVINTESIRNAFESANFPADFINQAFKSSATSMALIYGYTLISREVCKAYVGDDVYDYSSYGQTVHNFLDELTSSRKRINALLPSASDISKKVTTLLTENARLPEKSITFTKIKALSLNGFLDDSTSDNANASAVLLYSLAMATPEDFIRGWQVGKTIPQTDKAIMSAFTALVIFHLNRIHAGLNQLADSELHDVLKWIANSANSGDAILPGYTSITGCEALAEENWTYFLTLSDDSRQSLGWNDLLDVADILGKISGSVSVSDNQKLATSQSRWKNLPKNVFKNMPLKSGWAALAGCANIAQYININLQKDRDLSLRFLSDLTDTTVAPPERCETMMTSSGFQESCHKTYYPASLYQ
jgi:hypothetical protein